MCIRSSKVIFSRLGLSWVYIYNITERFPYRTHTHITPLFHRSKDAWRLVDPPAFQVETAPVGG